MDYEKYFPLYYKDETGEFCELTDEVINEILDGMIHELVTPHENEDEDMEVFDEVMKSSLDLIAMVEEGGYFLQYVRIAKNIFYDKDMYALKVISPDEDSIVIALDENKMKIDTQFKITAAAMKSRSIKKFTDADGEYTMEVNWE